MRRRRSAFTLLEVLVAVAVLSIILLCVAQTLRVCSRAYGEGRSRIDNFTKGRALLDLIAGDIQKGVFRPDLPAFGTGSQVVTNNGEPILVTSAGTTAFFTRRSGVGTDARDLSLVAYTMLSTNATLERADYPVPWALATPGADWSSSIPFGASLDAVQAKATPREIAGGVLDMEIVFQRQDGTLSQAYSGYSPDNPVVAVGISLALVDDQTMKVLNAQNLTDIQRKLAGSVTNSLTSATGVKEGWDASLDATFYQGYPRQLGVGLKTFERWVACQPPF